MVYRYILEAVFKAREVIFTNRLHPKLADIIEYSMAVDGRPRLNTPSRISFKKGPLFQVSFPIDPTTLITRSHDWA